MDKKIFLTHFFNTPPPEKGYKPITFLVTREKHVSDRVYFQGLDGIMRINDQMIKDQVASGYITELKEPLPIYEGQAVWIDSKENLYVAEKEIVKKNLISYMREIPKSNLR